MDEYESQDKGTEAEYNSDVKEQNSDYELLNDFEPKDENENGEVNSKPDDLKNDFVPFEENQDKNQDSISEFEPKDENQYLNELKLEKIKKQIRKYDWNQVSNNWIIKTSRTKQGKIKEISLDPTKKCSIDNPLYLHKEWLKTVYNNKIGIQMI